MSWSPSYIVDGSTPGVSNINTIFTSALTYINSLDRYALQRGAVNVDQSPKITPSGEPQVVSHFDTQSHAYADSVFGVSMRYTTYGAHDGTESAGVYTGDRAIIGHPDATLSNPPKAKITFNGGAGWNVGNTGTDLVQGILVAFNVDVVNIQDMNPTVFAMICLQFKHSGSGTWYTMPVTERIVSRDDHKINATDTSEGMWYDVPIRTFIGPAELTAAGGLVGTDRITDVRAMCSIGNGTAEAAILKLGSFRLSSIPILSSLV